MSDITIKQYKESNQRLVNKFYKAHKQNISCDQYDLVFCGFHNDLIIASLIIREYKDKANSTLLLRSLFVSPSYRKQGVAHSLVKLAIQQSGKPIFTICVPNLIDFYQRLGFKIVSDTTDLPMQIIKEGKGNKVLLRFSTIEE